MNITIAAQEDKFVYITNDIRLTPGSAVTINLEAISLNDLEIVQSSYQLKNIILSTNDALQLDAKIVELQSGATGLFDKPNGLPQLDSSGIIRSQYLPSYVDDILEYPTVLDFPLTGETDKIYVAENSGLSYRYAGSSYYVLGKGGNSDDLVGGTVNRFYTSAVEAGLVKTVNGASGNVNVATVAQGVKADSAVQPGQLATVATSGSYNDLNSKPVIPTNTNQLTNGAGFIASAIDKVLTGLSLASIADVVSTDTILAAIGKLQGQVTRNAALLPPPFDTAWYKSGLYYDAVYPYYTIISPTTGAAGTLYFNKRKILDNVTFNELSVNVTTAASGTVFYGIYASDATSGLPSTLLASGSASGETTGVKSTAVTLALTKGQVVWDAILETGVAPSLTAFQPILQDGALSPVANGNVVLTRGGQASLPADASTVGVLNKTTTPRIIRIALRAA
jgi:hypothetical protein